MGIEAETQGGKVECKHAVYIEGKSRNNPNDYMFVKEVEHCADGSYIKRVRGFFNVPREFWITNPRRRDHEEKKMFEKTSYCIKVVAKNHKQLATTIQRSLRRKGRTLRQLGNSPYLYGTDSLPETYMKYKYFDRYGEDVFRNNEVAGLDIETGVDNDEFYDKLITISLTFKDKSITAVVVPWLEKKVGRGGDHQAELDKVFQEYLKESLDESKCTPEFYFADNAGEAAAAVIAKAHEWQPDIVEVWNIHFDLPIINDALDEYGYDVGDVWSDPIVPDEYRVACIEEGQSEKKMASGKSSNLPAEQQWHTFRCPASFILVDGMAAYWRLRMAGGKVDSVNLDDTMFRHIGMRKLKFSVADHLKKKPWHKFMQNKYPYMYIAYNWFDCKGMEFLDDKINDMKITMSMQLEASSYFIFNSQPKRLCDRYHHMAQQLGYVMASTGSNMMTEEDLMVVQTYDFIVMLKAYMSSDDGINPFREGEGPETLRSKIYAFVSDIDIHSSYPIASILGNVGKETTVREVCSIDGLDEQSKRSIGFNMTAPQVNALTICRVAHKLPTPDDFLESFTAA